MTDHPDPATRRDTGPFDVLAEHATPALQATVVRYDNRPDRCTIYPAEAAGTERMVTWLTADADAFVRTEEMR